LSGGKDANVDMEKSTPLKNGLRHPYKLSTNLVVSQM